jgi:15-cis-phytoene synthase
LGESLSEIVRRVDEDRWLAAQFADPLARERLMALYAIIYEIARTPETVREAALGAIRLQWLREALAAALAGRPPAGHPALSALAAAHADFPFTARLFDQMIDARLADLEPQPFATWADLEYYASATAGATATLAAETLGGAPPMAARMGMAWGLCGLWRSLDFWRGRGRRILPPDGKPEELAASAKHAMTDLSTVRFSSGVAPAVLYGALMPGYLAGRALSPLGKRVRLVSAALRGRLLG